MVFLGQVVFATPGMLHAGLSLQLFKKWASNDNNMVLLDTCRKNHFFLECISFISHFISFISHFTIHVAPCFELQANQSLFNIYHNNMMAWVASQ
jgi:hypothetical protein